MKMKTPQLGNFSSKQFYEKQFDLIGKKPRARQSEPPMMQTQTDNIVQNVNEYPIRRPRPSEMGLQSRHLNSRTNSTLFPPYQMAKRNMNLSKNQASSKKKQELSFPKKLEMTLQSLPNRGVPELISVNSSKVLPVNRFLSPELKYATSHQQRKYSQNFQQLGFFKGSPKPSGTVLKSKLSLNENLQSERLENASNIQTKQQSTQSTYSPPPKRAARFSQTNNFTLEVQDEGSHTIYNEKMSNETKPKEISISGNSGKSSNKQYPHSDKKIAPITPSAFNPDKIKQSEVQFNSGSNVFRKQKELKQTVSTHSTFNFQKIEQLQKKESKNQPKRQQIKISDFVKGKLLGSGKFGQVCIVKHKYTGFVCALKSIPKAMIIQQKIIGQLTRQLKIQSYLDHPNIIKLYSFFHDKNFIYLLLELGSSGQLYKVIKQKQRLPEPSAAYVIKQVCEAVRYLHFFKIIHRDLKPQNIVIQSGTVKLCDFGWAVCRGVELRSTFCGTPLYVSPEILKGQNYDEKIDLWSIGILTYELLVGNIPFQINTQEQLVKIDIIFPNHVKVSPQAKDFVLKILKKNPAERLKINELLDHQFLKRSPEMANELEE